MDVHRSGLASVSKRFHEPNLEARSSHTYIFGSQAFFIRKTWQLCSRASEAAGFPFGRLSSAVCYSPVGAVAFFLFNIVSAHVRAHMFVCACMCRCMCTHRCIHDACIHWRKSEDKL